MLHCDRKIDGTSLLQVWAFQKSLLIVLFYFFVMQDLFLTWMGVNVVGPVGAWSFDLQNRIFSLFF